MKNISVALYLTVQLVFSFAAFCPSIAQESSVYINGVALTNDQLVAMTKLYGVQPLGGMYWYDSRSGAFGEMGGPVAGVMYPGHEFATLASDVSGGTSGVFINNRQLQKQEAYQAARLFGYPAPVPGRYWLDANGNMGVEGSWVPLGNIYVAMAMSQQRSRSASRQDNFWTDGLYSGGNYYRGTNGMPSQGYVSVPGYGPVSFGM